ncbi:MAG: ABC transporter ATP-binding protein [bacterium]|jgi:oligopeptide/dipeptide ABC transporter ATP-binding protein|nr:ABC transporter ATP-binding protein [bacterium]
MSATEHAAPEVLFEIRNLQTHFYTEAGTVRAVDGVSFEIRRGEVLGIVGESGSGKSVTCLSINRLIPDPPGRIVGGEILYHKNGRAIDLLKLSYEEMRAFRGQDIGMIFQEPMTSLNPVFTIGMQMTEAVRYHRDISKKEAFDLGVDMLKLVGIPAPEKRMKDYPHQFSGGMRQRVMIAMALVCNPALLIADEPTTALDVTIQAQILQLMLQMKEKRQEASIVLITHDLAVVAETCERVIVMYGGHIQEVASSQVLFNTPAHPYTSGLLGSLPRPDKEKKSRLQTIRGVVPSMLDMPVGCRFCTRCDNVMPHCETIVPDIVELAPGHQVRCHLYSNDPKMRGETA